MIGYKNLPSFQSRRSVGAGRGLAPSPAVWMTMRLSEIVASEAAPLSNGCMGNQSLSQARGVAKKEPASTTSQGFR